MTSPAALDQRLQTMAAEADRGQQQNTPGKEKDRAAGGAARTAASKPQRCCGARYMYHYGISLCGCLSAIIGLYRIVV